MNIEMLKKLYEFDYSLARTHRDHKRFLHEIDRLSVNREIESDTAEDTRSYDVNIQILKERVNDCSWRLNYACERLGLGQQFEFFM